MAVLWKPVLSELCVMYLREYGWYSSLQGRASLPDPAATKPTSSTSCKLFFSCSCFSLSMQHWKRLSMQWALYTCVWLKQKLWLFHSIHTHSLFHTPLGLSWTSTKMVLFWLWTWNVAHWQSWGTEVKGQEVQVSIRYPKLKQLLYNKWLNC